jgi:light-harvesting complex I chlorophyll a/b binding protein 1
MQTKELNNGRLAMIGWAGMTAQELVTHTKIFEGSFAETQASTAEKTEAKAPSIRKMAALALALAAPTAQAFRVPGSGAMTGARPGASAATPYHNPVMSAAPKPVPAVVPAQPADMVHALSTMESAREHLEMVGSRAGDTKMMIVGADGTPLEPLASDKTALKAAMAAVKKVEGAILANRAGKLTMSEAEFDVTEMAGVSGPLGFFDPLGFTKGKNEGQVAFLREVEIKHSRVAMLGAVGFLAQEFILPVPSYLAWQDFEGKLPVPDSFPDALKSQGIWTIPFTAFIFSVSAPEIFSIVTFESPSKGELFTIRTDRVPGDFGFDPLNLNPLKTSGDRKAFKEMQTKELNNGRLAMIGWAGMTAQELVTHTKIFE